MSAIGIGIGRRRVSAARVLAGCGVALLSYEAWTVVGWLADGPHQITAYRTYGSTSWYTARVVEAVVALSAIAFIAYHVRECLRNRRLTTDMLLVVGMASAAFWDPIYNWVTPAWLYSSNFLNVNDWLAHAPGVLNPDAGRMPWPIIIVLLGYPLWCVGFVSWVNRLMAAAQRRRPEIGRALLVTIALVASGVIGAAFFAFFNAFGLMDGPGYRLAFLGNSQLLFFFYSTVVVFGPLALLRWFRDDRGLALFERGTGSGSAPCRPAGTAGTATRIFAAIAACQIIVIVGWGVLTVPFSLASSPYPQISRDLINGLCSAPGVGPTTYGPCPGTPGVSIPAR